MGIPRWRGFRHPDMRVRAASIICNLRVSNIGPLKHQLFSKNFHRGDHQLVKRGVRSPSADAPRWRTFRSEHVSSWTHLLGVIIIPSALHFSPRSCRPVEGGRESGSPSLLQLAGSRSPSLLQLAGIVSLCAAQNITILQQTLAASAHGVSTVYKTSGNFKTLSQACNRRFSVVPVGMTLPHYRGTDVCGGCHGFGTEARGQLEVVAHSGGRVQVTGCNGSSRVTGM
ncbi:hypothetical protein GGX14DRAFT_402254 [Mycena pura]|uniref:Uncharacterized protein n=1 Tax=Mycena pura TaxID=153505 RepID=A0AAD6V2F8_9AGAR|nr:hypothetical protein GGX14DRAFT_402254 [Mycena pura]